MIVNNSSINKLKRRVLSHVRAVRFAILSLILFFIAVFLLFTYKAVSKSVIGEGVGLTRDFIFPASTRIKTNNGRINVLIMGKGGLGHDGADLTDTMILASISTTTKKMTLISIPRDIWIADLQDKINSAYMYGKQKIPKGGGLLLAKSTVESVLGVQIDYGVVIDFGGFKDVIDTIGGISVNVKNGFTDAQYPIVGRENDNCNGDPRSSGASNTFACRYMTVSFKPGVQFMNGDTALEFVRSRHGNNNEGNDIAREARQQIVIAAIVKKVMTPQIFTNLTTDEKMFQVMQKNIETDLMPSEEATLARYLVDAKSNMKSYTIPDNLLYNPPNEYKYHNSIYPYAFVFIPNNKQSISTDNEDWSDVQNWVKTVLP